MSLPYKYEGLEARFFDEVDGLNEFDDLGFYKWFIDANPGSTLDLACGTGRLLVPLAAQGYEVVGLDVSEEMLAICREQLDREGSHSKLIHNDMRIFHLEQAFANVIVPGFSIQLLADLADWKNCLESCYRCLKSDGQLLLSLYYPLEMLESGKTESRSSERKRVNLANRESVVALQSWKIDSKERRLRLRNVYQKFDAKGELCIEEEKEMEMRWVELSEVMELLGEIGFADSVAYGDFLLDGDVDGAEAVCVVAWK